ncbi:MAG: HD domain-containing protein [Chloroflexia bacterium]|nr:HD domain-containing protein [Chloroflexia bacterium]
MLARPKVRRCGPACRHLQWRGWTARAGTGAGNVGDREGSAVDQGTVLGETEIHVRTSLDGDGAGHDWWHVDRVRRLARRLAAAEAADPFVVELAVLLHDVADWKFHEGDGEVGPRQAREWLAGLAVEPRVIDHVTEIVGGLSFKGARVPRPMRTIEGRVVQDADRLDAIGAIGVARAFAYGGWKGQPIFDPGLAPILHDSAAAYWSGTTSTVTHFDEKLLLLKDLMNTDTARRLAEERHRFLEMFLARFHAEWDGTA